MFETEETNLTTKFFLENDIDKYYSKLIYYNGDGYNEPSRNQILKVLTSAVEEDFNFGLKLSKKLIINEEDKIDLWSYILEGFEKHELDYEKLKQIFQNLPINVYINYSIELARILEKYTSHISYFEYFDKKDYIIEILENLLRHSKRKEFSDEIDWINRSYNSINGIITKSIINIIYKINENQEEDEYIFDNNLKNLIVKQLAGENKEESLVVLCCFFRYLYDFR